MKKSSFLKRVSVLLSLALILTLVAPVPAMAASGGKLIKSVKEYDYYADYNDSGKVIRSKYELSWKADYKFDKSYPTQLKEFYYGSERGYTDTFKYKMKKNKPKSMKLKNSINKVSTKSKYNKKGQRTSTKYTNFFKRRTTAGTYKYNKNGFVTSYVYKTTSKNIWGTTSSNSTTTYNYAYKMQKGLPKELTTTYNYTYSYTDKKNPKNSYTNKSGPSTYYATFNGKGLITTVGRVSNGKKYPWYTVTYKLKKGKVVSAVVNDVEDYNDNGTPTKVSPMRKYTFSYTKNKAAKGRYANMINSQLGFDSEFGTYNWY